MEKNIKAVILDYGRTLHDQERDEFFEDALETIDYLKDKYKLAIVSITWPQTMAKRRHQIADAGLEKFIDPIKLVRDGAEKDAAFKQIIGQWKLKPENIAIVDDRVIRGIKWGNQKGCLTIWLKKGKFADELPDQKTGEPNFIIKELSDLKNIL